MGNITKNFSLFEFECPCEVCRAGKGSQVLISSDLVLLLQEVRDIVGFGIKVSSGVRCADRNIAVLGTPSSSHLTGLAVDILFNGSHAAFLLLRAAYKVGFSRIGKYPGWIHLDIDKSKAQDVLW